MKPFAILMASLLAIAVSAQSPLVVAPTGAAILGWTVPATTPQTFFDLTVHTTITLQALAAPLASPAGQEGTMELWLTNAGITTYVGNETHAANWHRAASGMVVANGTSGTTAQLTCTSCQDTGNAGLVLQLGTYGCAVRYSGVANQFCAVPTVPNVFSTAELSLTGGAIQYNAFVTPPSVVGGGYAGWSWYGRILYANGVVPHACATASAYGTGCVARHASIYEHYTSAAAAAAALNGGSLSFVPSVTGGYHVLAGLQSYPYVAPSAAAIQIPATNDGEFQQALSTPIFHPAGNLTRLFIHSNGFVSAGSNNVLSGVNWNPQPGPFLNAPATGWWAWHDLNPTESGSGSIWFEEDPATTFVYVTWLDVESYPINFANPSTFQMVFDPSSGIVTMNFVALDAIGGATTPPGDGWVVGYSPGGPSPDPSPTNLAALMTGANGIVSLTPGEVAPLALAASGRPLIGTTIDVSTSNEIGQSFGMNLLGNLPISPGVELTFLGAPGCFALVDISPGVGNLISNQGMPGLTMNVSLPIPNSLGLAGMWIYSQSIWLDWTANDFGVVLSNALRLKIGNY